MRCAYCNRRALRLDDEGDPACPDDCTPRKRVIRRYPWAGSDRTVREIAKATGISQPLLSVRLSAGWDVLRAVTTPAGPHGGYRHGVVGCARARDARRKSATRAA